MIWLVLIGVGIGYILCGLEGIVWKRLELPPRPLHPLDYWQRDTEFLRNRYRRRHP